MISLAVFYLQTEIEKDSEYILAISKSIQDIKKSRKYCWDRVSHLEQSLPSIKNPVELIMLRTPSFLIYPTHCDLKVSSALKQKSMRIWSINS